jgi:N utilization substance protein A
MTKIKYTAEMLKVIALFESVTKAKLKDCFIDDLGILVFVVDERDMSKAIGKGGATVRRIKDMLKRKIKIVEFSPNLEEFASNLIYPIKPKSIELSDGTLTVAGEDIESRSMLIGRDSRNLKNYKAILQRYFDVKEMRIM